LTFRTALALRADIASLRRYAHSVPDCVAKLFCPSERVRLIQDQASARNVDSRIHSIRFDRCVFLLYSFSTVTFATQSVKFRHCSDVRCTTAFAPKAEFHPRSCYAAQVPQADSCTAEKRPCSGRDVRLSRIRLLPRVCDGTSCRIRASACDTRTWL